MRAYEFLIEGKPGKAAMSYKRSNRYPDGSDIPESLPDRYQPASNPGVPKNQKCSNCLYYETSTKKCSKFKGDPVVKPAYWIAYNLIPNYFSYFYTSSYTTFIISPANTTWVLRRKSNCKFTDISFSYYKYRNLNTISILNCVRAGN